MGIGYQIASGIFCEVEVRITPTRYEEKQRFCPDTGKPLAPVKLRTGGAIEYVMVGDSTYSELGGGISEAELLPMSDAGRRGEKCFTEAIEELFEGSVIAPQFEWNGTCVSKTRLYIFHRDTRLKRHDEHQDVYYMEGAPEELLSALRVARDAAVEMGLSPSEPIVTTAVSIF